MKKLIIIILEATLLLGLTLSSLGATTSTPMTQGQFSSTVEARGSVPSPPTAVSTSIVNINKAGGLPPQGVYESCAPSDQESPSCLDRLSTVASAGFRILINYASFEDDTSAIIRYANRAAASGIKIIWSMSARQFRSGVYNREYVSERVRAVATRSATWGYYIADEPSITLVTSPNDGTVVSGITTIQAWSWIHESVGTFSNIQFLLDGVTNLGTITVSSTTNFYSVSWNTTQVPNGHHFIQARSEDNQGYTATSKPVYITVNNLSRQPAPLQVTTANMPSGGLKASYWAIASVTGGTMPYSWRVSSGTLPRGLLLDTSTGMISGTPSQAGRWDFTIEIGDSASSLVSRPFAVDIYASSREEQALVKDLSDFVHNLDSAHQRFIVHFDGGVDDHLSLIRPFIDAADVIGIDIYTKAQGVSISTVGVVASTLQQFAQEKNKQWGIVLQSFDNKRYGDTNQSHWGWPSRERMRAERELVLANGDPAFILWYSYFDIMNSTEPARHWADLVDAALVSTSNLVISTANLPAGQVGISYSSTLSASGGIPPYAWAIPQGPLPPGLLFSTNGVIFGTPTQQGQSSFTVRVTDSSSPQQSATRTLTINVTPAPPGFFPIVLYSVNTRLPYSNRVIEEFSEIARVGFNVIHSYQFEGADYDRSPWSNDSSTLEFLNAAQQNGLKVLMSLAVNLTTSTMAEDLTYIGRRVGNPLIRDHPALFGWQLYDEPETATHRISPTNLMTAYREIKRIDPLHPVSIATASPLEEVRPYFDGLDISMPQWLLVPLNYTVDQHRDNMTREIQALATLNKSTIQHLFVYNYAKDRLACPPDRRATWGPECRENRYPTREEIRFMSYYALIQGTQGLSFNSYRFNYDDSDPGDDVSPSGNPSQWRAISSVTSELRSMSPILLSPTEGNTGITITGGQAEMMLKRYQDRYYLFVVNRSPNLADFRVSLDPIKFPSPRITRYIEQQDIPLQAGSFTDRWEPYDVRIYEISVMTSTVDRISTLIPTEFSLSQNFPNPFNLATNIRFGLPLRSTVTIFVFNILGQVVSTPIDKVMVAAGSYNVNWSGFSDHGTALPSGVYFLRILAEPENHSAQTFSEVRKLLMIK